MEEWSQTVEISPPFVAARPCETDSHVSSVGRRQPAKTVPIATDPGVDVETAGSQDMLHLSGLKLSYVEANVFVLVLDHLVGVTGSNSEHPFDEAVIGKISVDVRDADMSLTLMTALDRAFMEYATGMARLLNAYIFLAFLLFILIRLIFLLGFGFDTFADGAEMTNFVVISCADSLDYCWGMVANQARVICVHPSIYSPTYWQEEIRKPIFLERLLDF